ncbi:MAG: kinase [Bacillota bacterium]
MNSITILNSIINSRSNIPRYIVGIDGLSRSGKTTLVIKIGEMLREQAIDVCVIHMDDYIVERKKRYNTQFEEWYEYYYLQWDVNWLKENLFEKLRTSNEIHLPFYDSELDNHSIHNITISDSCIILIDGIFLQRKEWKGFFDYLVYFDCPREIRFQRESQATQRNLEKFTNRYWKAEDFYIDLEKPNERADLILKN